MRRLSFASALALAACQDAVVPNAPGNRDRSALEPVYLAVDPWAVADTPSFGSPLSATRVTPAPIEPPLPERFVAAATPAEPIALPTSGPIVSAMHSSSITVLATSDDGRVAVSADATRSVRLWPSLDGKREPVVLAMRAPAALAIARAGSDLVIAGLDDAGQLELVRTAATGEAVRRVTIETARPLASIHATSHGVIAVRDDRAIGLFDFAGKPGGVLVADPGEHVASLAVRRDRVLAMLDRDGEVRGRWIEVAGGLRWGERTPALPIAADHVALAPGGKRVAGVAPNGKSIALVELGTGRVFHRPIKRSFVEPKLAPIGFLTDGVLAMRTRDQVEWWGRSDDQDELFSRTVFATGDGRLVSDSSGVLVLTGATDDSTRYLGYRMGGPTALVPSDTKFLATDNMSVVELDATFRARTIHELPKDPALKRSWHGLELVDSTHVLASTFANGGNAIYIIDLATRTATLVIGGATMIDFERSTGLLAFFAGGRSMTQRIEIARYDAKTGLFGTAVPLDTGLAAGANLFLLDPALAKGHVAAVLQSVSASVRMTLIRSFDPARDEPIEIASERTVENADDHSVTLDRELKQMTRLPSPSGAHTAELRDQRITLRDRRGRVSWTVPSHGAMSLVWTPGGELVAYGGGIAHIDLATGAMVDRQCGWRFGLWEIHPEGFGNAAQCEAP